jgi:class 3 adenylate cyclase
MGKARRQSWVWKFDQPAPAIWSVMADTARFNEAARLPKHEIVEEPQEDGSVRFFGRLRKGPFRLEWEERPVNWVADHWFEHCREFRNGPLKRLCASFELRPEGAGASGTYVIEVEPQGLIGRLMVDSGAFFRGAGKSFGKLAAEAQAFAAGARPEPFDYTAPPVAPDTRRRIDAMVAEIEATPNGHGLARRLAEFVLSAQEVDLWHLRPLKLARDWGVAERLAIELCLQAVKAGLLELRWDILCPRCRVAKAWVASLDRLPQGAHCASCNIDYDRDFSQNVEASFRPAAAVRPIAGGEYCLFGPMSTPHIKLHVTLDPGATRSVGAALPHGRYRLRTLEPGDETAIDWQTEGFPEVALDEAERMVAGAPAPAGQIALANRSARRRTLIVEDRAWLKDVLTADRLTSLQAFRDLFAEEVLRPGDDVGIAQVTLMFTDLKGSTALYERIGDARAYHLVREHFAFLGDIVRAAEGAIIKTVGDAVMAAFPDPAAAVRAALAVQQRVAAFNAAHAAASGGEAIVIKLGLHRGPCIAVTLNDRLDYFGSTVNLAARLQGQSRGGDIVLSREVLQDPGVAGVVEGQEIQEDAADLRGFAQPVTFLRLIPQAQAITSVEKAVSAGE